MAAKNSPSASPAPLPAVTSAEPSRPGNGSASAAATKGGLSGSFDFYAKQEPPRPDFALLSSSLSNSGRAPSASSDRPISRAEELIARGRDLSTRTSQTLGTSQLSAPVSQPGPSSGSSLSLGQSLRGSMDVAVPQFALGAAPSSSWAGWNSTGGTSLYSSRNSQQGEDAKSVGGERSVRDSEVPLFGPDAGARGDHNHMRELYENRYKLLRDDNQMLRENLLREQQAREDIARLMREECAALAARVKEANEAKNAVEAKMETELEDVKTLRITNRELSEACERRALAIDDLKGRVALLERRLDEAEQEKKSNGEVIGALETACAEVKTQLDIEKGSKSSAEVELQKQVADLIGNMEDMTAELERSRAAQAGEAKEAERLRELVKAMEVQANEQQHDLRASLESEFQQRSMMAAKDNSETMMQQLSKLNQLESQYASLQQEHADLQETTDILRAKLVTHRKTEGEFSETEGLREHISYLTKQLDLQNDQILNLGSAHEVVSNLQQANKDLISQRNALEERISSLEMNSNAKDDLQGQSTYQGPSTLGLGGFAVSGGFTSVNGSNPAPSSGQPPPPYQPLPLPVVKATPVKSQSPPQPTPQMMQMGMSGQPMMMVGSPLQPVQSQMMPYTPQNAPVQMRQPVLQSQGHIQGMQGMQQSPYVLNQPPPAQRGMHEMTNDEVLAAGFDPNTVIGC